jgi:Aminoglycoside-2''-adenylyltransferase
VEADDVIRVLDALDEAGVRHWVGGGWGVDALAGRQTRAHRDLDLNIDAADLDRGLAALGLLGYVPETDWLPSRVELRAPGDRWVDVHPVAFDSGGHGRQHDMDGGYFEYPAASSSRGSSQTASWAACRPGSSATSTPDTSTAPRTCTTWHSSTSWTRARIRDLGMSHPENPLSLSKRRGVALQPDRRHTGP